MTRSFDTLRGEVGNAVAATEAAAEILNTFRSYQAPSGAVVGDVQEAGALLDHAVSILQPAARGLGQDAFAEALGLDVADWHAVGLDQPPTFDRTRAAYSAPAADGPTLFAGPVRATNGPRPGGRFFETFLAWREEPDDVAIVSEHWPHPKNLCQSTRLLAGSRGFASGNCIVFFPENIASATPPEGQEYALFFFNKFHRIYGEQTLPEVRALFGERDHLTGRDRWVSGDLDPADCYRARSVWGYLHDCFHHRGPRPFDEHMHVKLNWFAGLLEEIKVDAESALACLEGGVPQGEVVFQFILFERMVRYPLQPDATRNFDSATGVLLYEWLRETGGLVITDGGLLQFDSDRLKGALEALVARIQQLESDSDDEAYLAGAKALVRAFLPPGEDGARFSIPPRFAAEAGLEARPETLDFHDLAY